MLTCLPSSDIYISLMPYIIYIYKITKQGHSGTVYALSSLTKSFLMMSTHLEHFTPEPELYES